ncbi:MAG: ABC transporter substrate-binding protein, partial [Actinomycetia bacterium]|nr:ABC transporter substrate-binding protein [Actinomycetes bacterium]
LTRLWRSRSIALMVLVIAFALVAAACSSDDGGGDTTTSSAIETTKVAEIATTTTTTVLPATTTTEPMPAQPYGGEAVIADDEEPPTLNPFVAGGDKAIVSLIGQGYLTGVQEIDGETLELIPELVTELPTTANGGVTLNVDGTMTVRYTIKDEAQWEDGTPISGEDFLFTLETILDPDLPIDRTTYEDIYLDSIVVGAKTFEYTLASPTTLYELIFGTILPKHSIDGSDFATDWNDQMWASGGPFRFDEWINGESIKLVRNDNYWKTDAETGQQLPYLDSVVFKFIPETESIINAFKAREIDVIQPPSVIETIEILRGLEPEGARVEVLSGPVWEHVHFQFGDGRFARNEDSCTESLSMRQAVGHAIDKQLLVDEILAGQVEPLDSYVTPFTPTWSQDSWAQYNFDSAAAAELYAAAVEETSKECSVVFSTTSNRDARVKMSELFVGMFDAAGIPYENQLEDSQVFFGETLDNGKWDLGEWAWVGSPGLSGLIRIHDVWDPEAPPPNGSNYYRWGVDGEGAYTDDYTARYAEVRDEMNQTVDPDELNALINEAENILADNAVFHPLYARLVTAAVWEDEIGGFKHNPTEAGYTWNIEDWYRTDA